MTSNTIYTIIDLVVYIPPMPIHGHNGMAYMV